MAESSSRLARLLLRYFAPLSSLRRVPILGPSLSWISRRLVPRNALVWAQIQRGLAAALRIRLNPRSGQNVLQGIGEPQVQQALLDHLRPGMTFYDLGANIGYFSLLAAHLVGPSGRVVSFEADPENALRLRENLASNNYLHALVEQKAVWSQSGPLSFDRVDSSTSPDRGLGHVAAPSDGYAHAPSVSDQIPVEGVSLDDYTSSHPLPDFLKCDVEGAEGAVFEGAARLLREHRPILLVEMHSPENHAFLAREFAALGYSCRNLDENHLLALPPQS